jgi:phage tail-like protein
MASTKYPIPVFHFTVNTGGENIDFTECSGLSYSLQTQNYRGGANKNFLPIKVPTLPEITNITLKKGLFQADSEFWSWLKDCQNVNPNDVPRRDITISLLAADHNPVAVWKIKAAFPVKWDGPSLNSTGTEIAMESVELAHEGLETEMV